MSAMAERKIWRRKRASERVAVRLWVRLHGEMADLQCTTLDLSDSGVRLRIRLEDLGLDKTAGAFDLSRVVTKAFGEGCIAELRHARGATCVGKELGLVRIGTIRRQAGDFEVGCRFRLELTSDEREMLGVEPARVG
jgi:hypothetical protein